MPKFATIELSFVESLDSDKTEVMWQLTPNNGPLSDEIANIITSHLRAMTIELVELQG